MQRLKRESQGVSVVKRLSTCTVTTTCAARPVHMTQPHASDICVNLTTRYVRSIARTSILLEELPIIQPSILHPLLKEPPDSLICLIISLGKSVDLPLRQTNGTRSSAPPCTSCAHPSTILAGRSLPRPSASCSRSTSNPAACPMDFQRRLSEHSTASIGSSQQSGHRFVLIRLLTKNGVDEMN